MMKIKFFISIVVFVLIAGLVGCMSTNVGPDRSMTTSELMAISKGPHGASKVSIRRIQPSDVLILRVVPGVEFEKELDLTVNLDGEVLVSLIGWVKVENLTTKEAAARIQKRLDRDFIVNPNVSLRLKEANSRAVVLLGQLKKPGTYKFPVNGRMTLLEAVAKAEGFTDIASLDKVKVVRTLPDNRQISVRINANNIIGGREPDLELEEGDLITVPESLF